MPLKDGDFVLVEYKVSVKETGELVDTTDPEEAKKTGVFDERERYGPRLVVVGEGRLIPGLEKIIKELDEGQERELEIPPKEGFGERDPSKIKILPRNQFIRSGVVPEPGKVVEIDGQVATIRSVSGGRVVVDFNHPLAGKTLKGWVKVVKVLDSVEERVKHLILRRLPPAFTEGDIEVQYEGDSKKVIVAMNEKALLYADMQLAKRIVASEVRKYLHEQVREIQFIETIRLAKEGEAEKAEEQSGEQPQQASQED